MPIYSSILGLELILDPSIVLLFWSRPAVLQLHFRVQYNGEVSSRDA